MGHVYIPRIPHRGWTIELAKSTKIESESLYCETTTTDGKLFQTTTGEDGPGWRWDSSRGRSIIIHHRSAHIGLTTCLDHTHTTGIFTKSLLTSLGPLPEISGVQDGRYATRPRYRYLPTIEPDPASQIPCA